MKGNFVYLLHCSAKHDISDESGVKITEIRINVKITKYLIKTILHFAEINIIRGRDIQTSNPNFLIFYFTHTNKYEVI